MNLKVEAAQSQLNYLWWILEPALFISIYYVVFGIFLNSGTDNYVAFLICGKIPFLWFSRTLGNSANSLLAGGGLMNQINIPKLFFPTVVILQDVVKTAVVFVLMMVVLWSMGYQPSINWFQIVPIMFMQFLFIASLSVFFASLVPFLPDLKFIIATFIVLMMFASGIFYDPAQFLLPEHRSLFLLNPVAYSITEYRAVLLEGVSPDWIRLTWTSIACLFCLVFSISVIKACDSKYPRLVLQ